MTSVTLSPPFTSPAHLIPLLSQQGYAALSPQGLAELSGCSLHNLNAWRAAWNDLPPDLYLKDGGRYRRRRHSCFVVNGQRVEQAAHRAHWQPLAYNALHGGMQRWFEPLSTELISQTDWSALLVWLGSEAHLVKYQQVFSALQFLLSSDRRHYLDPSLLWMRFALAYCVVALGLLLLQLPFWKLCCLHADRLARAARAQREALRQGRIDHPGAA